MRGRTVDGVRVCNLHHRLNSVVYFTHIAFIASTSNLFLSMASIMTNNQNVLEKFGGVDANSLCRLLNNNDDNGHPEDEPNIVQMSSYYDDDSLNNLFKDKGNVIINRSAKMQQKPGPLNKGLFKGIHTSRTGVS